MNSSPIPEDESARLKSLKEHQLLDTLPEEVYDQVTRIASEVCGTPIASLTLIDENRLWFKSKQGIEIDEIPREESFCAHTIMNPNDVLVIPDTRYDERFFNSPSVTGQAGIAFYAGVPVKGTDGYAFGSICVMDRRPRNLTEQKIESLKALAKLVNAHFELRRLKIQLGESQEAMKQIQALVQRMHADVTALGNSELDPEQTKHLETLEKAVDNIRNLQE